MIKASNINLTTAQSILNDSYEWVNNVKETVPKPRITVITLTFNKNNFIKDCIEGVLMQDNTFSYEYIIAEDFSTDGTREIVKEYAEKYPNIIRVITSDYNMGIVKNQFRSVEFARGEYIAFCDADDYWIDPEKLRKQVLQLEKHDSCHLCFHPVYRKDNGSESLTVYKNHTDRDLVFTTDDVILGGGNFCITSSIMIKGDAIKKLNKWSLNWPINDYHTQIAAAIKGGALYLNEVMSVYRTGVKNSWTHVHETDYEKHLNHIIDVSKINRDFDTRTGYRFHKAFMKREKKMITHFFRTTYNFDRERISNTKHLIKGITHSGLKARCYRVLILSFLYYKLNIKYAYELCRNLKDRANQLLN